MQCLYLISLILFWKTYFLSCYPRKGTLITTNNRQYSFHDTYGLYWRQKLSPSGQINVRSPNLSWLRPVNCIYTNLHSKPDNSSIMKTLHHFLILLKKMEFSCKNNYFVHKLCHIIIEKFNICFVNKQFTRLMFHLINKETSKKKCKQLIDLCKMTLLHLKNKKFGIIRPETLKQKSILTNFGNHIQNNAVPNKSKLFQKTSTNQSMLELSERQLNLENASKLQSGIYKDMIFQNRIHKNIGKHCMYSRFLEATKFMNITSHTVFSDIWQCFMQKIFSSPNLQDTLQRMRFCCKKNKKCVRMFIPCVLSNLRTLQVNNNSITGSFGTMKSLVSARPKRQTNWYYEKEIVTVPILGLFDLTCEKGQHLGGHSERASASLALQHINERQFIPGHRLVMSVNDTRCDSGVGVDAFFHAIYTQQKRLLLLIGPASDDVTESLAEVTPYFNLVQISFGTKSPTLSDRQSYPLFFRTVAPDSTYNDARIALLQKFSWNSVVTISESNDLYSLSLNELSPELEAANITLVSTVTVEDHDMEEHLMHLKNQDCRIFIGSFSPTLTIKLFCVIYRLKMYGQDYAWLLSGLTSGKWWQLPNKSSCSESQILESAQSSIFVMAYSSSLQAGDSPSGLSSKDFHELFARTMLPPTEYIAHAYDSVWAGALAIRKVLENNDQYDMTELPEWNHLANFRISRTKRSLPDDETFIRDAQKWIRERNKRRRLAESFNDNHHSSIKSIWRKDQQVSEYSPLANSDYASNSLASKLLYELQKLQFKGVSGSISFDGADRIGGSAFYQLQGSELQLIGIYRPTTKNLDFMCEECKIVKWPGGEVPLSSRVFMKRIETINPLAFAVMTSLAVTGIVLAISFLVFNYTYRKLKCVKLSSPYLNNITVLGCILVYGAVIFLGLDHRTLHSSSLFPAICTIRAYLLSAGFSLAFGSMFIKTYRVHQLFTRSNSAERIRNKLLQDKQLIGLVITLLIADIILIGTWAGVDPMVRRLHNLSLEISPQDRGVVYQSQVEVCYSRHRSKWLGALYVYKGLLVIVGVYMAWETRHVKIPALNDSQYIGMNVYNVVITSIIVITTAQIITEHTTLAYVMVATLIIISTTTTLCLLFVPKILITMRRLDEDQTAGSMGIRIESNTRRFVMDDHHDKILRAEARNRGFKQEIALLDEEIARLKKQLYAQSPNLMIRKHFQNSYEPIKDFMKKDMNSICGLIRGTLMTKYLHGEDVALRRAKRAQRSRNMHRSLPSLSLINSSQESDDVFTFNEDKPESRNVPPSPHPLQKARVVKRQLPENLNITETDKYSGGLLDLRYNLNFSTPQLNESSFFDTPGNTRDEESSSPSYKHHIPKSMENSNGKSNERSNDKLDSSSSVWSFTKLKKPFLNRNIFAPLFQKNQIDTLVNTNKRNGVEPSSLLEYQVRDLDILYPDDR